MTERADYATAERTDVERLRAEFDKGVAFTKDQAHHDLGIPERRFRAAVAALREQGYPVVSWSSEGSTYRKARDVREVDTFIDQELIPRMRHLERQARRIRESKPLHFTTTQQRLI